MDAMTAKRGALSSGEFVSRGFTRELEIRGLGSLPEESDGGAARVWRRLCGAEERRAAGAESEVV